MCKSCYHDVACMFIHIHIHIHIHRHVHIQIHKIQIYIYGIYIYIHNTYISCCNFVLPPQHTRKVTPHGLCSLLEISWLGCPGARIPGGSKRIPGDRTWQRIARLTESYWKLLNGQAPPKETKRVCKCGNPGKWNAAWWLLCLFLFFELRGKFGIIAFGSVNP
jgi:hypothetical protein